MLKTYSPWQVYDSLLNQGYSKDEATAMLQAMGGRRRTPEEIQRGYGAIGIKNARMPKGEEGKVGSSFWPNFGEGLGYMAGLAATKGRGNLTKWLGAGAGGTAGNIAGEYGSGTNFYQRASEPQFWGDIGGSIGGAVLGERVAPGLLGRLVGALGGRGAGAALGSWAGPLGAAIGGTLGGWLIPKVLPGSSKSVDEDKSRYYRSPF